MAKNINDVLGPKLIDIVEEGSPADNSGIVQAGDRLVSINEVPLEETGTDEAMQMLAEAAARGRVTLEVEFDIADSVVPSSGTFVLKLQKAELEIIRHQSNFEIIKVI